MKAIVFDSIQKEFYLKDIKEPEILDDELLIRVMACGICGSDLHLWEGLLKPKKNPIIPGHEAAGIVEKVGQKVQNFQVGDRVVISAGTSCRKCKFCLEKRENLCKEVGVLGFERDGAFAEYIAVPESNVFKLPNSIPFEEAAILADAVSTPYHAIRFVGEFKKNQNILILGCGGLGIHAIKIAKALEANQIYGCDMNPSSLENAKKAGATEVIKIENSNQIKQITKNIKINFSLILDFTGIYNFIEPLLRLLEAGGRYILVGISKNELNLKIPSLMIFNSLSICGSYGSDSRSIPELLELYQSQKLHLKDSISGIYPLFEFKNCLYKLKNRIENPIRYVINPNL